MGDFHLSPPPNYVLTSQRSDPSSKPTQRPKSSLQRWLSGSLLPPAGESSTLHEQNLTVLTSEGKYEKGNLYYELAITQYWSSRHCFILQHNVSCALLCKIIGHTKDRVSLKTPFFVPNRNEKKREDGLRKSRACTKGAIKRIWNLAIIDTTMAPWLQAQKVS